VAQAESACFTSSKPWVHTQVLPKRKSIEWQFSGNCQLVMLDNPALSGSQRKIPLSLSNYPPLSLPLPPQGLATTNPLCLRIYPFWEFQINRSISHTLLTACSGSSWEGLNCGFCVCSISTFVETILCIIAEVYISLQKSWKWRKSQRRKLKTKWHPLE
jgi:hypothetical protein